MTKREFFLRILTSILFIVGVSQLALSYIHITAATKIFANEIGLYLFLFIIFGLTTGFNAVLLDKPRSLVAFIFSSVVASISGVAFLRLVQADVIQQEALTMIDVNESWRLAVASIFVYVVGAVFVPYLSWPDVKAAAAYE